MLPAHRIPARLVVAALLAVATACGEQPSPTAIPKLNDASLAAGDNGKVKLRVVHLSTNTLKLNGPTVDADFSIYNSGVPVSGISVSAEIVQPAASRQAIASTPTKCSPGDPAGFLPVGGCDMILPASADNSAPIGVGTLVEGPATFTMHVYQTVGATTTELSSKSVGITLVGKPSISALTLASATLAIGGPTTTWNGTVVNPAGTLQNVFLQAYIVQNGIRRPAGGLSASCGAPAGNLPNGSCAMSFSTSAPGNALPSLEVGAATFELTLNQTVGSSTVTFDTKSLAITLVSTTPTIESVTFASPQLVIGATSGYTVQIKNPGFPVSPVLLQGEIVQDTPNGTVRRGTTAGFMQCGQAVGILPTTGTGVCTMQLPAVVPGPGPLGTLVPGLARFVAHLRHRTSTGDVELDTETVEITLISANPAIVSLTLDSYQIAIGESVDYTVEVRNPGPPISLALLQGEMRQDTPDGLVVHGAGGFSTDCGAGIGVLPTTGTGTCSLRLTVTASNTSVGGTFIPGLARFVLQLSNEGTSPPTALDSKTVEVTLLAAAAVRIADLQLPTSIAIGAVGNYTATLVNPTSAGLAGVGLQGWMEQGTTRHAANGTAVNCLVQSPGLLPVGTCVMTSTFTASNTGSGTGTFVVGAATLRLEMTQGGTLLDVKLVPITLTTP